MNDRELANLTREQLIKLLRGATEDKEALEQEMDVTRAQANKLLAESQEKLNSTRRQLSSVKKQYEEAAKQLSEAQEKLKNRQITMDKAGSIAEATASLSGIFEKAQETARAVFAGVGSHENMPTVTLAADDFADGKIGLLTVMVKGGMAASNGEARRLVTQGGVTVNDEKAANPSQAFTPDDFKDGIIVKKGKKVIIKFVTE